MKVIKPNRLSGLTRPYRFLKQDHLAITAYAMVDFSSGFSLVDEQQLWALFGEESAQVFGAEALDFGIPKPKPEIILNAYGFGKYAVRGRTAVSVSVNNVRKDLWVTGDRYWSDGKPSEALPFDRIPICWRNAFGGEGYPENQHGKGFRKIDVDGMPVRFLPNVEDPANPVVLEGQRYAPAGYAAIPIEYPGRNRMMGTYDEKWRINEFPGFARDIDWEYFNQSPPRQRLNYLDAGDEIIFTHLHPEKPHLATSIPALAAKAFIRRARTAGQASGFLEEVPLRLTTYWAFPHLEKAILIYQGAVSIDEDDASDISHILYAAEHADAPRAPAYYEDIFHKRVDPQTSGMHAVLDAQLVDARFMRALADDEIELSPLLRNKLVKLEKELGPGVARAKSGEASADSAAGIRTELDWLERTRSGKVSREALIEEMLKKQQSQRQTLSDARRDLRKSREALAGKSDDVPQSMKDERAAFLKESRQSLLDSVREAAERRAVPVAPGLGDNSAAQDALRQLRLKQAGQFQELLARAPGATAARRDYSGRPRALHRIFGLQQRVAEPLPEGCEGYDLHDFAAAGASYAGWDVSGLTLRDSRITGCDFGRARMACGDFERVVFTGCDFSSADWSQAHFTQCQFIDCRLPNVGSDKARFVDSRFVRCDLAQWMHFRITMQGCTFEQCRFVNFAYMRARLGQLAFKDCRFLRHSFIKASITGIRMESCHIDSMAFVEMKPMSDVRVLQCQASKVNIAPGSTIEDFEISHSAFSASSFRKVGLGAGRIVASDLSHCDFSESRLREVSLEDSFFKRSLFIRTDLSRVRIANSDFSEAQMKSADLAGTQMRHVSFFSADLAMVKVDENTVQQDMLMTRSNIYPLRN
ncbi:E3 ubiquitin-protein ligase SopA [Bordetella ansorpii]|uniref:E3 ubiquitin-protein ligase SopA n=1 Tax=Bordetella ansorpii TaxID=288768 RepID=A0A157PKG5_9BORD|nr:DUF2169 domain-containing protein [Bordetella ansorpii]SAI34112.1 E3 ubiquitin-protein ligase SopA [Bordetella ansorpii]